MFINGFTLYLFNDKEIVKLETVPEYSQTINNNTIVKSKTGLKEYYGLNDWVRDKKECTHISSKVLGDHFNFWLGNSESLLLS